MENRIESIDVLRGFALLDILIINIMSFSMPSNAYYSPIAYDSTFSNQFVYCFSHIIADQKFMVVIWLLLIFESHNWMKKFQYGRVEWM